MPSTINSSEVLNLFNCFEIKQNEALFPYTTWKIGGNAEFLVEVKSAINLQKVLEICLNHDIKYRILGKASNVLISDNGLKGLTIINRTSKYSLPSDLNLKNRQANLDTTNPIVTHRHSETGDPKFYSFADLEFEETSAGVDLTFDSAVELASAITVTTKNNISGLQWFAGIPGTVGGCLYNNIHGGTRHFSDYFKSAKLLIPASSSLIKKMDSNQISDFKIIQKTSSFVEIEAGYDFFGFGYDSSILRLHSEIVVLCVTLKLYPRDDTKALQVAREWFMRKKIQPKKSCGSVFQCITLEEQEKNGFPTASAGYIIDKVLNWRGKKSGDVWISEKHANFIENLGQVAKSEDVLFLIKEVKKEVKNRLGIVLHPEINFLGFSEDELKGVIL